MNEENVCLRNLFLISDGNSGGVNVLYLENVWIYLCTMLASRSLCFNL